MITSKFEDNVLYLEPHGRIDSGNAAQVEQEVFEILNANDCPNVIMDIDDLEYISSAGLRVVLKVKKARPALKIINASSEVYEIFEMTGFSEMIDISRGYRKLSVDGCEAIGKGANGEVYRLDPDTIIKVYLNPDSLPDIHRERELARRAFVLGVPTAIPYDVVRVGNSYGSVFELLNAKSLAKILAADESKLDECVKISVDLLKIIHSTEVLPEDMPDMREVALGWAAFLKDYLPAETADKLYKLVEAVPVDHHMIHGDYHIKNVMIQNGEALLIDMDTLAQGSPIFEFGSIYNAYVGFHEPAGYENEKFLGISCPLARQFWEKTIKLYFDTEDEEKLKTVEDKSKLMGYTRLMRRSIRRKGLEDEKMKKQIEFYKENIIRLVDELDTLVL